MKMKWKRLVALTAAATMLSSNLCAFAEDTESRRLSVLQVDGKEAYVMKKTSKKLTAAAGMKLGEGNKVSTGKDSYIYIEADDDKTLKLDTNTMVDVEKASPKTLKLTLRNGKLFFNVDKPLADDEELEFHAAHTSMSIRGTSGYYIYSPAGLTFYLIEGKVHWKFGENDSIEMSAGQVIEFERDWGDSKPGPGSDAGYVLKGCRSFTWRDLDAERLKTILENRDKVDLSAIGLDSEKELELAQTVIDAYEELKKAEELARWLQYHDDDDDDRIEEAHPKEDGSSDDAVTS